jgi:hypothetical protein
MKKIVADKPVTYFAYGLLALGSALAAWTVSEPASAATACRDIDTVQQSADLNKNTGMGGHVTQHILGMNPPSGMSQQGKTLFKDGEKFGRAWGQYKNISNPKFCTGNSSIQQVFQISGLVDALSCRAVDGAGKCTKYDSFASDTIAFAFINSGGKWILNTAYPVPMP